MASESRGVYREVDGTAEMASQKRLGWKCRISTVVLLLLASIAALVAVAVIQRTWRFEEYTTEYGIVIDSGSSRSNVYLYQWPGEKQNQTGIVTETKNCRVKGNGISEMLVDPQKDSESWNGFQVCLKEVAAIVPVEKHNTTRIYLGATAGMRLLHEKDEQRSNQILANLRKYLSSTQFDFQNASIISGEEEGLYGWVTVNYLKGNFLEKNLWNAFIHPEGKRTTGSMDLGGASTQIAFEVPDHLKGPDYMRVRMYGYDYNVYTHSFLCYGKNEMQKRVLSEIIKRSPDPAYIRNPCYQEGYSVTLGVSDVYDSQCTSPPAGLAPDQKFYMVGVPDSDSCLDIVRTLFNLRTCSHSQCSLDGVEQPPVTGDFMAYAGFFYTARALLLNGTSEMETFNSTIKEFCHTNWTTLQGQKTWISERYLRTYCYSAHYVFTLLTDGYKFDTDTWSNIHFEKEVKNTSVGWSLGYMLSMSNMIPSEVKLIEPMTHPVFSGLVFLFSALTIITVVLVSIFIIRMCY